MLILLFSFININSSPEETKTNVCLCNQSLILLLPHCWRTPLRTIKKHITELRLGDRFLYFLFQLIKKRET